MKLNLNLWKDLGLLDKNYSVNVRKLMYVYMYVLVKFEIIVIICFYI